MELRREQEQQDLVAAMAEVAAVAAAPTPTEIIRLRRETSMPSV